MRYGRTIADLLTILRGLLGFAIAALGVIGGQSALPLVVVALVLAWSTDLLDGIFARLEPEAGPGRLANVDAAADMAVGLGVMAYLALSGFVALWLGALIIGLALVVRIWHSRGLAFPFYAVSFLFLIVVVWQQQPALLAIIGAYFLLAALLRWRRVFDEYLPEFFAAISSLRNNNR